MCFTRLSVKIVETSRSFCDSNDPFIRSQYREYEFGGLEWWNGAVEWTTGVEYWTGLLECHAHKCTSWSNFHGYKFDF